MSDPAELFDAHAAAYEADLRRGLDATGEGPDYFARRRTECTSRRLVAAGVAPRRVLDFGCGTGGSTPFLLGLDGVEELVGVDVSEASLDVARQRHADPRVCFRSVDRLTDDPPFDLAFCNGVFHHIPPTDRAACVRSVRDALRPGGLFAMWENNPWNPGVRYVMSRVSFDRDAITLAPPESRRLLRANGFEVLASEFWFIFPRLLRPLRGLERLLRRLPIGGQYLTLGRVPVVSGGRA